MAQNLIVGYSPRTIFAGRMRIPGFLGHQNQFQNNPMRFRFIPDRMNYLRDVTQFRRNPIR